MATKLAIPNVRLLASDEGETVQTKFNNAMQAVDDNVSAYNAQVDAADTAAASAASAKTEADRASTIVLTPLLQIRKSKLDNPLCHILKKNKLVETLSGALSWTRATTATYVDRYGVVKTAAIDEPREEKDGWLIEGASANLALHSEDFTNAIYTKTGGTITLNSTTALDMTLTADLLTEDTSTAVHRFFQSSAVTIGVDVTFSIFVKPNGRTSIEMDFNSGESTVFNLTTKVITEANGSKNSIILDVGNGWFRASTTVTATTSTITYQFRLHNGSASTYTGDGVSGAYVWGVQLEELPLLSSYISTTTASITRIATDVSINAKNNMPDTSKPFSFFTKLNLYKLPNQQQFIFRINDGTTTLGLVIQSSNTIQLQIGGINIGRTLTTADEKTLSIAIIYDGTKAYLYIDNLLAASANVSSTTIASSATIYVGKHSTFSYLNNHLSDFKFYDFAFNTDELSFLSGE